MYRHPAKSIGIVVIELEFSARACQLSPHALGDKPGPASGLEAAEDAREAAIMGNRPEHLRRHAL